MTTDEKKTLQELDTARNWEDLRYYLESLSRKSIEDYLMLKFPISVRAGTIASRVLAEMDLCGI